MATKDFTDFLIYRWRYILGYGITALLLAGLLVFAGLYVPGGISPEEIRGTVISDSLSLAHLQSFAIPNAPYHTLQALIFHFFGVSTFTIKLPSLILALLSAAGLILLLRRWFKPNIAVLTSLLAITTGQFLFIAQNGVPSITYVFWPVFLLLLGTQITRVKRGTLFWKLAFAGFAAASLYTPLSVYPLIAVVIAVVLHPHLRNVVRRLSKPKIAISLVIAAVILAPLIGAIITDPQLGFTLLGAPSPENWPPNLLANIQLLFNQFFIFWRPSTTTLMTPVFGLGSVLLILLGMYRIIRTRDTTRSYLIIIWILCLIPIVIVNPKFTSVLFVPSVLLMAAGLTALISYWYRLFPLNPYARIVGLIPLIVLVLTMVGSGLDRYMYGYHYDPNTAGNFSRDLKLIPSDTVNLVVSTDELPFYTVVAKHRDTLKVSTVPSKDTITVTRAARGNIQNSYKIYRIITTTSSDRSDRLYVYKKIVQ